MRKQVQMIGTGTGEDPRRPNVPEGVSFSLVEQLPDGTVIVEYDDPRADEAVRLAAKLTLQDKLVADVVEEKDLGVAAAMFDDWVQPTGSTDAYPVDAIVVHNDSLWRSTTAANVWEPGVSGWHRYGTDPAEAQAWVQPTGAHDAYPAGAVVTHNGQTWTNTHGDGNSWEPGVYGWAVA